MTKDAGDRDATEVHGAESAPGHVVTARDPKADAGALGSHALVEGSRFGRYEIGRLLGSGGMGIVYRARDTQLQRDVALKVLNVRASRAESLADAAAYLMREARTAASLHHPNVVSIFDVGEHDGIPFLSMELIHGRSLRAILSRDTPPLASRIAWLEAIAAALAAAHARGLVHRDIKPDNVIVRDDGVVKVLDFGIARRTSAGDAPLPDGLVLPTLTRAGFRIGTPAYMAPEQLRGEKVDARADQFAWGVVAYEVLTGKRPWTAASGEGTKLAAQILGDPPPPMDIAIPAYLRAIVDRTLAKDRADRFASIDDVIALLARRGRGSIDDESPPLRATKPPWIGQALFALVALVMLVAAIRPPAPRAPRSRGTVRADRALVSPSGPAAASYQSALQSFRDGAINDARESFADAAAQDDTFAAAHLRFAMLEGVDTSMREHLLRAEQHRANLDLHDRSLLVALAPLRDASPDWILAEDRLAAAAKRFPDSIELEFALAFTRFWRRDYAGAIAAYDAALEIDPGFGAAWAEKGRAQMYAGDSDGARATYERCLSVSPSATTCLFRLTYYAENAGACDEEEALARRLIALRPQNTSAYQLLANAQFALGRGLAATRAALEQRWAHGSSAARALARASGETQLAIAAGDFVAADARAREWEALVEPTPDEWSHLRASRARMLIALETGRASEAAALARMYEAKLTAWTRTELSWSTRIHAIEVAYRSGALDRARMHTARDSWLAGERARIGQSGQAPLGFWWILAYAQLVSTPEDAREAMAVLPQYEPLPNPLDIGVNNEEHVGEAFFVAGETGRALRPLQIAAGSCEGLEYPFDLARADLVLGEAYEANGDTALACASYARVVAQWGDAVPRSITAAQAARRATLLRCALPVSRR